MKYKDILINKFSKTADYEQGIFFYIKNIKTKRIWSIAALKANKQERYKITFSSDSNQIDRVDGNIETKTKITVVPNEGVEIRRLTLKNNGPLEETLEVSSFLEPVLSKEVQENAHPAFNNLFLKYEWQDDIMLVERRRRGNEESITLAVSFFSEDETIGQLEYEIDKAKLVGRGNISVPEMIASSKPFSRNVALTVESGLAFRRTIKLEPDEQKQISLILGIGSNKQEAINNVQKYQASEKIKRAIELGKARSEAENEYLGIRAKQAETYQKILGYLIKQNPLKSLQKLPKDIYPQSGLWKFGISGDIPILTVKIEDPNDSYVIRDIVKAKEFFMLKNCPVDIVILNEEKNVYEKYVKEKIENAIVSLNYLVNTSNGIYVIEAGNILEEEKNLLLFRSNLVLDAGARKYKAAIR